MRLTTAIFQMVVVAIPIAVAVGCAKPPEPEPPPAPAPVAVAPPQQTAKNPDQDWNIFPDPTTGEIEIYHKGEFMGVINGTEPPEQDPPLPHKPEDPGFDQ